MGWSVTGSSQVHHCPSPRPECGCVAQEKKKADAKKAKKKGAKGKGKKK
jgi:hypothetical protein